MPHATRRDFLRTAIAGAATLVLPARAAAILADPYAPFARRSASPVRVRGRVHAAGRGLAGVRVTDGLNVVATGPDGRYTLVSEAGREFIYLSVPAGFAVPQNPSGTALFYQRLEARNGEASASFELRRAAEDQRHSVLFLADTQTENAQEISWLHEQTVPDVVQTVRQLGVPAVGLAVGDIMFDHLELYPDYERAVQGMGIPFFQVVGNHDLDQPERTDEASTRTFSRHFGPRYYSFERGAVHYVVLDDVFWHGAGYIGYLDADQLAWLAGDLAHVEPGRTVIVTLHIPTLGSAHLRRGARSPAVDVSVTNRQALYRLLEPYRAHIVCGHTHESDHVLEQPGVHEHVLGTVCGAWWSGPICGDGTPSGYAVFEVDGEDVRWRYQSTSHPADHQIRCYAAGGDPKAPDEVVANIWDWDPEWRVLWYADGERRGIMARRIGLDPLSVQLHSGPELPARRPWVDPYPTRHLFYAPATPGVREYRVEATDRFGRTYTSVVPATAGA